ncbi:MAG TPA: hypothetical protein VNQ79_19675 [Blastocatellia bacterium]|nr:hypothetical protein [Blastocatellia bacterium]
MTEKRIWEAAQIVAEPGFRCISAGAAEIFWNLVGKNPRNSSEVTARIAKHRASKGEKLLDSTNRKKS